MIWVALGLPIFLYWCAESSKPCSCMLLQAIWGSLQFEHYFSIRAKCVSRRDFHATLLHQVQYVEMFFFTSSWCRGQLMFAISDSSTMKVFSLATCEKVFWYSLCDQLGFISIVRPIRVMLDGEHPSTTHCSLPLGKENQSPSLGSATSSITSSGVWHA